MQNISETVSLMDAEGRILMTTGDYTSQCSATLGVLEQRTASTSPSGSDTPRIVEVSLESLASPGVEITDEVRARHADGHWEHLQITAVNLLAKADVGGLVVTTRNITEVKQAQQVAAGQSRVLELIARGESLHETLTAICTMVRENADDATPAIFLVEDDRLICHAGALPQYLIDSAAQITNWREQTASGRAISTREPRRSSTTSQPIQRWRASRDLADRRRIPEPVGLSGRRPSADRVPRIIPHVVDRTATAESSRATGHRDRGSPGGDRGRARTRRGEPGPPGHA